MRLAMTVIGPSRQIAAPRDLGCFVSKADMASSHHATSFWVNGLFRSAEDGATKKGRALARDRRADLIAPPAGKSLARAAYFPDEKIGHYLPWLQRRLSPHRIDHAPWSQRRVSLSALRSASRSLRWLDRNCHPPYRSTREDVRIGLL
jgi:hypothetical protein